MVAATIAPQVDESIVGDVMHKPADLVGMGFDDDFVFRFGIDDPYDRSISVYDMLVDVGVDVVQPHFLAGTLESGGGGVVQISLQELLRGAVDDLLLGHIECECSQAQVGYREVVNLLFRLELSK